MYNLYKWEYTYVCSGGEWGTGVNFPYESLKNDIETNLGTWAICWFDLYVSNNLVFYYEEAISTALNCDQVVKENFQRCQIIKVDLWFTTY